MTNCQSNYSFVEDIIDFENSSIIWETLNNNTIGQFRIEAICEVFDKKDNQIDTYYLTSMVYACNVFSNNNDIFKIPPYSYQALFSSTDYKIFRDYLINDRIEDNSGKINEIFKKITFNIKKTKATKISDNYKELYNKKIIAKIRYESQYHNFNIYFPIKHINFNNNYSKIQIETGPVCMPEKKNFQTINDFILSYVVITNTENINLLMLSDINKFNKVFKVYNKTDFYKTYNTFYIY